MAIARLISDSRSPAKFTLHTLVLASCQIRRKGGKALAYGLAHNRHLKRFYLRLNPIHDSGGKAIANALVEHSSLVLLDLAGTHIGNPTCYLIGKMMLYNKYIREVNLSSNKAITSTGKLSLLFLKGELAKLILNYRCIVDCKGYSRERESLSC